ncbi:host attachment protein [Paracoccus sp. (in: a-proteobacteria)]|uniref:baeRF12 domain-containing protein n=1 Tax=Paracoccus sp. TaxID=267 RepID=UPI00396C84FB
MLPHNAVVVVADGHSATIFRNAAKHGLELTQVETVTPASLSDPAKMPQLDEISPRDEEEADFALRLTRHLNEMVLKNKLEDIAIIADPSTLGVMRKHYHKELQLRLRRELSKTLTNSDIPTIQNALA